MLTDFPRAPAHWAMLFATVELMICVSRFNRERSLPLSCVSKKPISCCRYDWKSFVRNRMFNWETQTAKTPIRNPPRKPLERSVLVITPSLSLTYPMKSTMTNMIKLCLNVSQGSLKATLERSRPVYNGTNTSAKEIDDGETWQEDSTCIRPRRAEGSSRSWSISSPVDCSETIVWSLDVDDVSIEDLVGRRKSSRFNRKRIYPSLAQLNGSSSRRDSQNDKVSSLATSGLILFVLIEARRRRGLCGTKNGRASQSSAALTALSGFHRLITRFRHLPSARVVRRASE